MHLQTIGPVLSSSKPAIVRRISSDPMGCEPSQRSAWPLTRRYAPTSPRKERGEVRRRREARSCSLLLASPRSLRREVRRPPSPLDQLQPIIFGEHVNAEFARLGELVAGVFAGDDVIGLLRHRARDLGAESLRHLLGLIAGEFGIRYREPDG